MVFKEYLLKPTINNKRLHLKINLLMNFAGKVSFSQKTNLNLHFPFSIFQCHFQIFQKCNEFRYSSFSY